jgi:hypothetical protein
MKEQTMSKSRRKSHAPECMMVCEESSDYQHASGLDLRCEERQAGYPDTPQACTWVSLEPGFQVLDGEDCPDCGTLVILHNGADEGRAWLARQEGRVH